MILSVLSCFVFFSCLFTTDWLEHLGPGIWGSHLSLAPGVRRNPLHASQWRFPTMHHLTCSSTMVFSGSNQKLNKKSIFACKTNTVHDGRFFDLLTWAFTLEQFANTAVKPKRWTHGAHSCALKDTVEGWKGLENLVLQQWCLFRLNCMFVLVFLVSLFSPLFLN